MMRTFCAWAMTNPETGEWTSKCGQKQYSVYPTGFKFCPYCGRMIEILGEER